MSTTMHAANEQAWKNAVDSVISSGVHFSGEDVTEYPFAEIYTGPCPSHVPQAELIGMACNTLVHACKSPSSLTSHVVMNVQLNTFSTSSDGFVINTTSDSGLGTACRSAEQVIVDSTNVVSNNLAYKAAADAWDVKTKKKDSLDSGKTSYVAVDYVNQVAFLSSGSTEKRAADDRSLEDAFKIIQLESENPGPYLVPEDHYSSPPSEYFGRQSSASHSSTNSFSTELVDERIPEYCPPKSQPRRKGECFLCSKVKRVQGKDECLVCSAKYCSGCVLKAMGSMPEGRKCSGCVGKPISDSRRKELGKPSKMLCRLLSNLEVQQIMKAETESPANQLRPEQLFVNGIPLTSKQYDELLHCAHPPSKLKPGRYWYDAGCGYWGKEGEKPEQMISLNMSIGGELSENASAGTTGVYINNREITKLESHVLKLSGFSFPRQTRLWLDPDGSFKEEGHNRYCGNIYEKALARSLCRLFLLPLPNTQISAREPTKSTHAYDEGNAAHKILLLGHAGSGTSTIINQIRFLYGKSFTPEDLQDVKVLIQKNIWKYLFILLEARERFEDEEKNAIKQVEEGGAVPEFESSRRNIFALNARLQDQAAWFLQTDAKGEFEKYCLNVIEKHASIIEELWRHPAIQATYGRRAELHLLPDAAEYFLEKVASIACDDYSPSQSDILHAGEVTNKFGLAEVQFQFLMDEDAGLSGPFDQNLEDSLLESWYHLIRVDGSGFKNGCKLLKLFDDVEAVLFCVGLDSYDQLWSNGNDSLQNKMLLSRDLFETIIKYPSFKGKPIVLFLNKYDAFEKKVLTVPLTTCEWFSDFNPVKSSSAYYKPAALGEQAYTYIAHKFKKHFEMVNPSGVKLFTCSVTALQQSSISAALQYLKAILWEGTKKQGLPSSSFYSTETSSLVIEAGQ